MIHTLCMNALRDRNASRRRRERREIRLEVLEERTLLSGNLLVNGSFETGTAIPPRTLTGGGYLPLNPGSAAIDGWTVTQGEIDYVGGYWNPL